MEQPEDVEIILSHQYKYKLHSNVLARNSKLLAGFLQEENAAQLKPAAVRQGVKIRWVIELQQMPTEENPAGKLGLVPLDTSGRPISRNGILPINENGRIPTKLFYHYESIFYAFYNQDIPINEDNITAALEDTVEIIQIAEYLQCVPIVSRPIGLGLYKHGQTLFRSIAAHPWAWVGMASRIKSEMIYREAIIHIAGNWNAIDEGIKGMLDEHVHDICLKHHNRLDARRKKLELTLSSAYPGGMCRPVDITPIKREEYAKDILVWMAMCFFRHWFTQRIIDKAGSLAPDGGYALYKQFSLAGEAYMDKSLMNQFHTKFPLTKKAMNVIENHLLEIKECLKEIVVKHGILQSECQLDTSRYEVPYLTCVKLEPGDYPWSKERGIRRRSGTGASGLRRIQVDEEDAIVGPTTGKRNRANHENDEMDLDANIDNKRLRNGGDE